MRVLFRVFALGFLLSVVSIAPRLEAQADLHDYVVKFVCGRRAAPTVASAAFDAVAPGQYYTAINIRNASRDTIGIRTRFATTLAAPVAGPVLGGPPLRLGPHQALELDCAEILRAAAAGGLRVAFLKGFTILTTDHPLDVVAVYSAATAGGVVTMDVESVPPRATGGDRTVSLLCPDLVVGTIARPTYDASGTSVRVVVGNVGTADAGNVVVSMEDPGREGADRMATATIPTIAAGGVATVTLTLPYEARGNARVAAFVVQVDPKNEVRECDETNNTRTLGSP